MTEEGLLLDVEAMEAHAGWPMISRLPVVLSASIPMHRIRVRDLLALRPGMRIESDWNISENIPLAAGGVRLCWGEFEVVQRRIALRMTRLA